MEKKSSKSIIGSVQGKTSECNVNYQKRIVAFIDILGFKDYTMKHNAACIYNGLNGVRHEMDSAKFKNLTISYFSDCIFISIPFYRDDSKLLYEFIEHLSNASASLFKTSDVLLRGAVTIGKVFHKNTGDPAFGPALIEAYELESNIANYPRIILSSECFGLIRKYSSVSTNPNFTKILKRYSDGCIGTDIVKIWKKNDDLPIDGDNHHKLKKLYTEAIGNTKIFKKIDWLKNEFEKEAGCDLCAMKDNKLFPLIDL